MVLSVLTDVGRGWHGKIQREFTICVVISDFDPLKLQKSLLVLKTPWPTIAIWYHGWLCISKRAGSCLSWFPPQGHLCFPVFGLGNDVKILSHLRGSQWTRPISQDLSCEEITNPLCIQQLKVTPLDHSLVVR